MADNTFTFEESLKQIHESFSDNLQKWWNNVAKSRWEINNRFRVEWEVMHCDGNTSEFLSVLADVDEYILKRDDYYPIDMILKFFKVAPDEVMGMLENLFDDSVNVYARIEAFQKKADELVKEYFEGSIHYQDMKAATTYLWLYNPEKYYILDMDRIRQAKFLNDNIGLGKEWDRESFDRCYLFFDKIGKSMSKDLRLCRKFSTLLKSQRCEFEGDMPLAMETVLYVCKYPYLGVGPNYEPHLKTDNDVIS